MLGNNPARNMSAGLVLHGYWRSSAAYRVRIALNLKGLAYQQATVDLRARAHKAAAYRGIAPHGLVPTLVYDEMALIQSPAILEWLDESYPEPPLLPAGIDARGVVRAMAAIVACDIHPLNNLRVLITLRKSYGLNEAAVSSWIADWIHEGFTALEGLVAQHCGRFCFGDTATIADCTLVPQLYSAARFGVDLTPYPYLVAVGQRAGNVPAFAAARPDVQPDADRP
jgi:maleylpyruvate isomerase